MRKYIYILIYQAFSIKNTRQLCDFMDLYKLCKLTSSTFSCFLMKEQMMLSFSFEN